MVSEGSLLGMKDNMLFVGDPESQSILDKFQEQNTNFCIIKDYRKRGSAVWGWIVTVLQSSSFARLDYMHSRNY